MKKLVLFLLIFLIPTQLGAHFWPPFSFASGFKIDYLSPTIYLVDLFIITYLLISLPTLKKIKLNPLLLILALLNIVFSNQPLLSFIFWSKLGMYILLFVSLKKTKNLKKTILTPLIFSSLLVVIVQLTHLIIQKSIGGPLYYLGERTFTFYTPNIAKLSLGPLGIITRPYSIFSHPNSLAGYLLIVLVLLKSYRQSKTLRYLKAIVSIAIVLTFSKAATITLLLLVLLESKKILKKTIPIAILVGLLPLLVNFTDLKYTSGDSFLTRAYMGYSTLEILKQNFFTGTGLRAFIPSLSNVLSPSIQNSSTLQPVHSLVLLILSELGIIGIAIIILLIKPFMSNSKLLLKILLIVALTGAVDHYWWTLPQNQLILILALALSIKNTKERNLKA